MDILFSLERRDKRKAHRGTRAKVSAPALRDAPKLAGQNQAHPPEQERGCWRSWEGSVGGSETLQGCGSIGKSPVEWESLGEAGLQGSSASVPSQISVPFPGTQQCQPGAEQRKLPAGSSLLLAQAFHQSHTWVSSLNLVSLH